MEAVAGCEIPCVIEHLTTYLLSRVGDAVEELLDSRGCEGIVLAVHHQRARLDLLKL